MDKVSDRMMVKYHILHDDDDGDDDKNILSLELMQHKNL